MRRYLPVLVGLALVAAWLTVPPSDPSPAVADAPAGWGTIKGQVVYNGAPPVLAPLKVDKDKGHCEAKGPLADLQWVVNPKSKGVRDVFVWLQQEDGSAPPINPKLKDPPKTPVVVDQPMCEFVPNAVGLREGQVLEAKNSSPIVHNFKFEGNPVINPGGNPLIPAGATIPIKDLKADRLPVRMSCSIHGWMVGWVRVFNHPYYAVTDPDGKFEIKDAPAGNYVAVVWHGGSGWLGGSKKSAMLPVAIKAGGTTDLGALKIGPAKQ